MIRRLVGGMPTWALRNLALKHFEDAINQERRAIDAGFRPYMPYSVLAAAYALYGKRDEARSAMAEARRLNPKLTVEWLTSRGTNDPTRLEGSRQAGLPEE